MLVRKVPGGKGFDLSTMDSERLKSLSGEEIFRIAATHDAVMHEKRQNGQAVSVVIIDIPGDLKPRPRTQTEIDQAIGMAVSLAL